MTSNTILSPRLLDSDEGSYTTSEAVAPMAETVYQLVEDVEWSLSTLATCEGLTPAQAALGAELRNAVHRVDELFKRLALTAA